VLNVIEDKADMVTAAVVMFLFGMYLGQSGQGWIAELGKGETNEN